METNKLITAASALGTQAFKSGQSSTAGMDQKLQDLIVENPDKRMEAVIPLIQAWVSGWHTANSAAAAHARRESVSPRSTYNTQWELED